MSLPRATAVIPARGGSKGIPRKNLVPLCGKPLVVWSIEAAQACNLIDHVLVSTDDEEIASVAALAGAEVVIRPAEMATDKAPTDPVIIHALVRSGHKSELTVLLQPTSPIRPKGLINTCIGELVGSMANSLFTASQGHHFIWHRPIGKRGLVRPLNFSMFGRKRRQDMEVHELPLYENGSVYVMNTELLIKTGARLIDPIQAYEMPEIYSIDINHKHELAHAELLLRQLLIDDEKRFDHKQQRLQVQ